MYPKIYVPSKDISLKNASNAAVLLDLFEKDT